MNALPNGAKKKDVNNMPKLEDIDPNLDPIVRAAMIDDPEDEEEEKSTQSDDKSSQATAQDDHDEADDEASDQEDKEEGNEVDDDKSTEKEDVEDEDTDTEEDQPDKKMTRKEKREAKRRRYLEAIRKEGEQRSNRNDLFQTDPNYKPLDYEGADEFDAAALKQDREKYGQNNFSKGAQLAQVYAEQEKFWQGVEYEDKLLQTDPKYGFLNEKSRNYDPDLAEEMHERFFALVGYNPDTQMTARTDVSFAAFVKEEVDARERWAARNEDRIIKNSVEQRAKAGIRPSGSASKPLGKIKPGDISKMSQAEFEKHEAEIDRQILAELGQ